MTQRFFTRLGLLASLLAFAACGNEGFDRRKAERMEMAHDYEHAKQQHPDFQELVGKYESKERLIWQKPETVIELMGELEGKTVADIGAGTGYFAFRLAGKAARVIAIDIDPRFISFMDSMKVSLPELARERFETRLASVSDPRLADEEADVVLMVNTYAYIENREAYMGNLLKKMRPGGQLLIVDYKKKELPEGYGPSLEQRVALGDVQIELGKAGFEVVLGDDSTLDYQYVVVAKKPSN